MPLATVKAGQKVRFVNVRAGQALKARLAAMGLVPGSELEVVTNSLHGPFIVSVKGSRLVLGRGMAQKIMVV